MVTPSRSEPGGVVPGSRKKKKKRNEAAAAVPQSLIEQTTLIGPKEKIRDDLEMWRESCITELQLYGDVTTLRTMAELVL